ncbi:MAG: twin-arginine translocase TatA/TatE family subunit [Pyrinomonadaceae bacterium]
MHVFFLFLETIGTGELLLIAFVALIVFGPRKLPELGRSLGRSLGEFKRASDDFKRTWEHEVEMERLEPGKRDEQEAKVARSVLPSPESANPTTDAALGVSDAAPPESLTDEAQSAAATTIARNSPATTSTLTASGESVHEAEAENSTPPGKQDWL